MIYSNTIRVLFVSRSTLFSSQGGDTIQLTKTAEFLRKLNVEVEIRLAGNDCSIAGFSAIHIFNMIRPADGMKYFRSAKIPIFLSPIYVDYSFFERKFGKNLVFRMLSRDLREYIKTIARSIVNKEQISDFRYLLYGHHRSVQLLCRKAFMLLPNSVSEYHRLSRDYDVSVPYRVIPNAIDPHLFSNKIQPDTEYAGAVICVARIEQRKNQLNLIYALNDAPYKVFIIGKCSPNHQWYLNQCKSAAASNIYFVDHLNHEQLPSIYAAARVHALPSWFETTGLCSLEAAMMGCSIVVTDKGDQIEYFSGHAHFCDPEDIASIRRAVDLAYASPLDQAFQELLRNKYTWQNAASETLEAYKMAL